MFYLYAPPITPDKNLFLIRLKKNSYFATYYISIHILNSLQIWMYVIWFNYRPIRNRNACVKCSGYKSNFKYCSNFIFFKTRHVTVHSRASQWLWSTRRPGNRNCTQLDFNMRCLVKRLSVVYMNQMKNIILFIQKCFQPKNAIFKHNTNQVEPLDVFLLKDTLRIEVHII